MVVVRAACFTSSVVLFLSITGVGPEARADTLGVEAYLAALLDVPRDADHVSVIQTRHDTYAATLNLMDLLKAMKIPPDRLTSPGKITFELKNEKQDIWRIAGQGQYFASTKLKDSKQSTSMVTNIQHFDVSGRFEPEHGSDLLFTSNGGEMQIADEKMQHKVSFDSNSIALSERPRPFDLSNLTSSTLLHRFNWRADIQNKTGFSIKAKSVAIESRASSMKLKAIKNMLRFGDRLELHASEGDPLFPNNAVADMATGEVEMQLSDVVIETDKKESGGSSTTRVSAIGTPLTDRSPVWMRLAIDGYWQKSRKEEADLDPFAPRSIQLWGSATPMDATALLMGPNPLFVMGVNNDMSFIKRAIAPKGSISFSDVHLLLHHPLYRLEATGTFEFDAGKAVVTDFSFVVRTKNLDKVIAANAEPASRQKLNAYFQTLLYVAKGAGVSDGKGGLTWSFARHDGKITLNDRPFTLPGAARN
jgi:hypothetical protein